MDKINALIAKKWSINFESYPGQPHTRLAGMILTNVTLGNVQGQVATALNEDAGAALDAALADAKAQGFYDLPGQK